MPLHDYQRVAANWAIERPRSGLFLEPGLGKTYTTITVLESLRLLGEVEKTLLVAPLRVARDTWPDEFRKWASDHDLTYSVAVGNPKQRAAALAEDVDVTILSITNLQWLLDEFAGADLPHDMLVVDELSMFKSRKTQRFKNLRPRLRKFKRTLGLTGTPAPNSLLDLWAQMGIIDQGDSLGTRFTKFREEFFHLGTKPNGMYHDPRYDTSYQLNVGADDEIYERTGETVISMRTSDHLKLPACTPNVVRLNLGDRLDKAYRRFLREQVLLLGDDAITAKNAAALLGKLQQFAGGEMYNDDGEVVRLHDVKLEALRGLVEELQGSPLIVVYAYKHERDRILAEFPEAELYRDGSLERWNRGEIPILVLHPASAGHGLNLQHGGHTLAWYGLTWSSELHIQTNARVMRQGQEHPVVIHYLVARETADERILDVLKQKRDGEESLLNALRAEVARVS